MSVWYRNTVRCLKCYWIIIFVLNLFNFAHFCIYEKKIIIKKWLIISKYIADNVKKNLIK